MLKGSNLWKYVLIKRDTVPPSAEQSKHQSRIPWRAEAKPLLGFQVHGSTFWREEHKASLHCHNKTPHTRWLEPQDSVSSQFWSLGIPISRFHQGLAPGQASLLAVPTQWRALVFYKDTNIPLGYLMILFMIIQYYDIMIFNYFLTPNMVTLEAKASKYRFWGNTVLSKAAEISNLNILNRFSWW